MLSSIINQIPPTPQKKKVSFDNLSFLAQQTIFRSVLILPKCTPDHVNVAAELSFSQGLPQ